MIDLHAHYAMQLSPWPGRSPGALAKRQLLSVANRLMNYKTAPAVDIPGARAGGIRAFISVVYDPFAELDPVQVIGSRPRASYVKSLVDQMDIVEHDLASHWHQVAALARSYAQLEEVLDSGKVAVLHGVEGGFHLGTTPAEVRGNVSDLAERGIVYVTLAHLFFRGVATNAACMPPMPDSVYHRIFRQPRIGLTELGRAAVERMFEEGVLVDIKHMSRRTFEETLELFDRWDPDRKVPIIASHMACRLGGLEVTLDDQTVTAVAERGGVLGVQVGREFLRSSDGSSDRPEIDLVLAHIEHLHDVTGSHRHTAIGTDLDGFNKPVEGLESYANFGRLRYALDEKYGSEVAQDILHGNAMRVLKQAWRVKRSRNVEDA